MTRHDDQQSTPNPPKKPLSTPASSANRIAPKQPTSVNSMESGEYDGDPGHMPTPDLLALQCRKHPEVLAWSDFLHPLVDRARTLLELSHRYESQDSVDKKKTGTRVIRCCRAIVENMKSIRSLDGKLLLAAQSRTEGRRSTLGGLCGMDAAVHVGAWLVSGFADVGVSAKPKRLRWTSRLSASGVDFKQLLARQQPIAEWVAASLTPQMLDGVHAAFRADLSWLCQRLEARQQNPSSSTLVDNSSQRTPPGNYEDERGRLLASQNSAAVKTALDSNGDLQARSCQILQATPDVGEIRQKGVVARLAEKGVALTINEVGYSMRAMVKLGFIRKGPKYRRTPLGSLFIANCMEMDPSLKW